MACLKLTSPGVHGKVRGLQSQDSAHAEVAELVDALASGASGGNPVEVQVLFSAPSRLLYQQVTPTVHKYSLRNSKMSAS